MTDNEKNYEERMREEIKEFVNRVDTDTKIGAYCLRFVYGGVRFWLEETKRQKGGEGGMSYKMELIKKTVKLLMKSNLWTVKQVYLCAVNMQR